MLMTSAFGVRTAAAVRVRHGRDAAVPRDDRRKSTHRRLPYGHTLRGSRRAHHRCLLMSRSPVLASPPSYQARCAHRWRGPTPDLAMCSTRLAPFGEGARGLEARHAALTNRAAAPPWPACLGSPPGSPLLWEPWKSGRERGNEARV